MSKFLGRPQAGGWLAMGNMVAWLLAVPVLDSFPQVVSTSIILVLSFPFATFATYFLFPTTSTPSATSSTADLILGLTVYGLILAFNSFVWGYGLARLLGLTPKPSSMKQPATHPEDSPKVSLHTEVF